ncbi:uncharacterized protein LOC132909087 [Bombus pascuorum]|uniref:uncharacterized protein LOC132909087 n=1 Tax=Bombus pascuorum TaxID=65598 RepID=UPI00298E9E70|nr:uncharacterized protein LOC132909087 [Bombus pascuorum]
MRYLDLTLDSHWTFGAHFERLIPSVEETANALGSLLPRLGGPGVRVRRLYASVVREKLLYGASIWAEDVVTNSRNLRAIRRLHRAVAIRITRVFRTISAAVLAGLPPFELQALRCREIYLRTRSLLGGVGAMDANAEAQARRELLGRWRAGLDTRTGASRLRDLEAVLPNWDVWLDGDAPPLTHRVTQLLTGHGCFGEYLPRIGKGATAHCHHCGARVDSAQHTLENCPTWAAPRHSLTGEIGYDLSPPAILEALLTSERGRNAVASFCELVILRKDVAERVRERDFHPERIG